MNDNLTPNNMPSIANERLPHAVPPSAYYYGQIPYYGGMYGGRATTTDEEESLIGTITIGRMLRVCQQRWITILVFCILGAIGSFAVFKILPTIYQAESLFEMNIRPSRVTKMSPVMVQQDLPGTMDELFNTRLVRLRSRAMLQSVVARYEADRNEKLSEEHLNEVISAVIQADVSLQRRSRIVRIAVRSTDPVMAADIANAYAAAAETFAQEENKAESENAVAWLKATVDAQRHLVERTDQEIFEF